MSGKHTVAEKIHFVKLFNLNGDNAAKAQKQLYREGIESDKWPTKTSIARAEKNFGLASKEVILNAAITFSEVGSVEKKLLKTNKRTKHVRTADIIESVRIEVLRSPDTSKSHRRLALLCNLRPSTVYQILKELHMRPYIPRRRHALNEDDPSRRMEWCEMWMGLMTANSTVSDSMLWSDEASFHLSGSVNRHNCVYWREDMPEHSVDLPVNSPGITVWVGMSSSALIGPVFFKERVTGGATLKLF